MIKIGDKVKYVNKDIWDPLLEKDIEEFKGIFEVIGVSDCNGLIFIKSKYNIERSEEQYVRGFETHNEKYWCLNMSNFEEYPKVTEFDKKLDELFDF